MPPALPTLTLLNPDVFATHAMQLQCYVKANGSSTTVKFELSIDSLFTESFFSTTLTLTEEQFGIVKIVVPNLISSTNYYYRAIAENTVGTVVSNTKQNSTLKAFMTSAELENTDIRKVGNFSYKPIWRDFNQFTPQKSAEVYDEYVVAQGLNNIFDCHKKGIFFMNDFGSYIDTLPFEINDEFTPDLALSYIIEATDQFEPRAYIEQSKTTFLPLIDENRLDINVAFGLYAFKKNTYTTNIGIDNNG